MRLSWNMHHSAQYRLFCCTNRHLLSTSKDFASKGVLALCFICFLFHCLVKLFSNNETKILNEINEMVTLNHSHLAIECFWKRKVLLLCLSEFRFMYFCTEWKNVNFFNVNKILRNYDTKHVTVFVTSDLVWSS